FRHRTNCLFNGRVGIDAMLIIKIDNIDIEPPQTSLARLADIIRLAADPAKLRLDWIAQDSKLRRDYDLFAMAFNRAAEQLFVRMRSVHVGGVEESDAELERAMDRCERFLVI